MPASERVQHPVHVRFFGRIVVISGVLHRRVEAARPRVNALVNGDADVDGLAIYGVKYRPQTGCWVQSVGSQKTIPRNLIIVGTALLIRSKSKYLIRFEIRRGSWLTTSYRT
jgi:hypothetical protein